MPDFTSDLQLVDHLSEVQALLDCAFMACTAIDDGAQGCALQSLLSLIHDRVEDLARHAAPGLLAA